MSANLCAYKCICSFLFCICVFLFYILCIFALYWGSPSGHVSIYVCIFVFAYFYSAFVYFYFVFLYFCTVLGKHQVGMSAYMCAYLYLHIPILYLCNFIFYVCIFSLYWGRTRWACLHICVNICIYVFLFCICVILFSIFVFLHCTGEAPGGHVCISLCIFVFAYFYSVFVYFYFVFLYFCTVLGKHQVGMSAYLCGVRHARESRLPTTA